MGSIAEGREIYIPEDGSAYVHFKRKNKDHLVYKKEKKK